MSGVVFCCAGRCSPINQRYGRAGGLAFEGAPTGCATKIILAPLGGEAAGPSAFAHP